MSISFDAISPIDLIRQLHSSNQAGKVLVELRSEKSRTATVPAESAHYAASQFPLARQISISVSSFYGRDILLNFVSGSAICIDIDHSKSPGFSTPRNLAEQACWRLRGDSLPLFSALITGLDKSSLIWIVDKPFDNSDLGYLYACEMGFQKALKSFGAIQSYRSSYGRLCLPGALTTTGEILTLNANRGTVDTERLRNSILCKNLVSAAEFENLLRSSTLLHELNLLLYYRFHEISSQRERYPIWISCYAGALSAYTDVNQLRHNLVALIESLENASWEKISDQISPCSSLTYAGIVDLHVRNARAGEIRLVDGFYEVRRSEWQKRGAELLGVTSREVAELQLRHFVPDGTKRLLTKYIATPTRVSIGLDKFLPPQRSLLLDANVKRAIDKQEASRNH